MNEKWKCIPEYPSYEVSNLGRVRRLTGCNRAPANSEPLQVPDENGYLRVALFKDGKRRYVLAHRLVAKAFLPNPLGLPTVNHVKEPKTNNAASNLEWASYTRQMRHAQSEGLRKVKGYTFRKGAAKPWIAQIETGGRKNRKCKKLGAFVTEIEARAAYLVAVEKQGVIQ